MAVAQAPHGAAELTRNSETTASTCASASTPPPAGCPAVLLAEAKVPYDIVPKMDEINARPTRRPSGHAAPRVDNGCVRTSA